MAITRAQQARQMLKKGSEPIEQAGVMNYMPSEMVTVPKIAKSSPDTPTAKLAYITPEEQDILVDLNLYGSLKGKPNRGPGGISSLEGDFGPGGKGNYSGGSGDEKVGGGGGGNQNTGNAREDYIANYVSKGIVKGGGPKIGTDAGGNPVYADARLTKGQINAAKDFRALQQFKSNFNNETLFDKMPSTLKVLSKFIPGNLKYRQEFLANNPQLLEYFESLTEEEQKSNKAMTALKDIENLSGQTYEDFLAFDKGAPGLKYSGNVGGLEKIAVKDEDGNTIGFKYEKERGGGDGMSEYERRLLALEQSRPAAAPEVEEIEETFTPNFRLMAGGGMADKTVGGIMDLESSRQMYGLGKLVKKIGRSVKKIAKSPIGKAAIGAALFKFGGESGIMKSLFGVKARNQALLGKEGFLGSLGLTKGFGSYMPTVLGGMAATTLGSYFLTPEEEEQKQLMAGADLSADPDFIMRYPELFQTYRTMAEGGSTEEKEPVAKKVMPLIDMDGKEKDYRETGGFVDMGRMEKADDVPARLSKNEFVFTADAVRNAGDGSVDKGAEVMYNMMKNLESGGDVSEESQGLDGARKMFQTSQRLEEVL